MFLRSKKLVAVAAILMTIVPFGFTASTYADAGTLICDTPSEGFTTDNCDMFIDEKVSVNESSSAEAPTASQAVQASTGDTITWTITVDSDSTNGNLPDGTATVTDTLPSQVSLVSTSTSTGTYSNGTWTFDIADNIPATLTVVAKANTTGLFTNTVTLSGYVQPCYYNDTCLDPAYNDSNAANNTANAYVNIPQPVVTTNTTLTPALTTSVVKAPNTGFGINGSNTWIDLTAGLLLALPLAGLGYKLRQLAKRP